jgi:hypothetical protein
VIPLCLIPTFLLGVTYFLLVEYVMTQRLGAEQATTFLRVGGAGLILLFVMASLACAVQISDRMVRPVRALLRVAEGAEIVRAQGPVFPAADAEMRYLFLRVHTLVQQTRSGAQAVLELEDLRREVEEVTKQFRAARGSFRPPEIPAGRPDSAAGRLAHEATRFVRRLRSDIGRIEGGLDESSSLLAELSNASSRNGAELEASAEDVEKLATVWSLEIERMRRNAPLPGSLGSCFHAFRAALQRLHGAIRARSGVEDALVQAREEVDALRRVLVTWQSTHPDTESRESRSSELALPEDQLEPHDMVVSSASRRGEA